MVLNCVQWLSHDVCVFTVADGPPLTLEADDRPWKLLLTSVSMWKMLF